MLRQGTQAYRNVVAGLVLPVTLASCFMHEPVEPADLSNAPPPTGTNTAPEIWGNAPRVIKVSVDYSFTPQAMDPDADSLSFSINNRPMWLTFDATSGRISGVPLLGNEGTYNDIEIAVNDGQVSTMLPRFSISVEPTTTPNMPPEIDGTPVTSVAVGATYSFTPTGSDPDGDPLTYSIQNRPGWATFSSSTGQLSGTPQPGDEGTYTDIAITVSDNVSGASLPAFSITVNTGNATPTIGGTPSPTVNVDQSYLFTPTASDPDGDNLTFSIQNKPPWAQFNTASGALSGTPQAGDGGSYTNVSISVSDGNLSDTLPDFTITVNQVSLGSVTLNWTAPTQNTDGSVLTNLAGFKIYYGTSPDNYPNQITINNPGITAYLVDNLSQNTWYFVSTAFDSSGMESDFSNVAIRTIN